MTRRDRIVALVPTAAALPFAWPGLRESNRALVPTGRREAWAGGMRRAHCVVAPEDHRAPPRPPGKPSLDAAAPAGPAPPVGL